MKPQSANVGAPFMTQHHRVMDGKLKCSVSSVAVRVSLPHVSLETRESLQPQATPSQSLRSPQSLRIRAARHQSAQDARPAPPHPDRAPSPCRKTHPPPAAASQFSPAPRRSSLLPQLRNLGSQRLRRIAQLRSLGRQLTPSGDPTANPFSAACRKNVIDPLERRRNRLKIRRLPAPPSAPRPRNRIAHIVRIRSQHCIHHVISKSAHILQIKMQPLAQKRRHLPLVHIVRQRRMRHLAQLQRQVRLRQNLHNRIRRPRSANGSFDPVGCNPIPNIAAIVWMRSASPSNCPSTETGMSSSVEAGMYCS